MPRAILVSLLGMLLLSAAPASAQRGQNAVNGAALYTQRCQSCHEGGAVARAPSRDVISALSPDRIVELGSGDAHKTRQLLDAVIARQPTARPKIGCTLGSEAIMRPSAFLELCCIEQAKGRRTDFSSRAWIRRRFDESLPRARAPLRCWGRC